MARGKPLGVLGGAEGNVQIAVRKALMQSKLVTAEVPIELGGRERRFCLNMNAMVRIEEETGVNLLENMALFDHPSMRQIRIIVWAMLADDDPELENAREGLPLVGRWISVENMDEILNKMMLAFTRAMPEPKDGESPEGTARKNARSSASTGS